MTNLISRLASANVTSAGSVPRARHRGRCRPPTENLAQISLGVGIGIVDSGGRLFRGASGTAGELGHIAPHSASTAVCWCGKVGCIGVRAAFQSIAHDLNIEQSPTAAQRINDAASAVGEASAIVVDMLNPATLVLGGELMHLGSDMLARIRAVLYEQALSLSTRRLQVTVTDQKGEEALNGAAILGAEILLTTTGIERQLAAADGFA